MTATAPLDRDAQATLALLFRLLSSQLPGAEALAHMAAAFDTRFTAVLDAALTPARLRIAAERVPFSEAEGLSLIRYFASRDLADCDNRDRFEWLVTHVVRGRLARGASGCILEQVTGVMSWPGTQLLAGAGSLLTELRAVQAATFECECLQDLVESGLVGLGRSIKRRLGVQVKTPGVLAAIIEYNLDLRTRFERMATMGETTDLPGGPADYAASAEQFAASRGRRRPAGEEKRGAMPAVPSPSAIAAAPSGRRGWRSAAKGTGLRTDPQIEESKLQATLSNLVTFARSCIEPVSSVPLPNSELCLQPADWHALRVEYPSDEHSFRVEFNTTLRQALGLLACLQEQTALYRIRQASEFLWKKHVTSMAYLVDRASVVTSALERVKNAAAARGLVDKVAQMSATIIRLDDIAGQAMTIIEQTSQAAPAARDTMMSVQ